MFILRSNYPTLSLGINLSSDPCLRKMFPAVCCGLIPIPSSVIMADVAGDTLNSSAANFNTAVKGVLSGTLSHPISFSILCHIVPLGCVFTNFILLYIISEISVGPFNNTSITLTRCSYLNSQFDIH